jgi:hypothetical protein
MDAGYGVPVRAFATQHACDRESAWPGEQSAAGVRNATDGRFSIPGRIAAGAAPLGDGFPGCLYTIQPSMSSILEQADGQTARRIINAVRDCRLLPIHCVHT